MNTEEEMLKDLATLLEKYNIRKYTCMNGFGYSQIERDIVSLLKSKLDIFEYLVIDYGMYSNTLQDGMQMLGEEGWRVIRILDPIQWANSDGMFIRVFFERIKQTK